MRDLACLTHATLAYDTDEQVIAAALRHSINATSAAALRGEIERYGAVLALTSAGELVTIESAADVRGEGHGYRSGQVRTARGDWAQAIGSCPVSRVDVIADAFLGD